MSAQSTPTRTLQYVSVVNTYADITVQYVSVVNTYADITVCQRSQHLRGHYSISAQSMTIDYADTCFQPGAHVLQSFFKIKNGVGNLVTLVKFILYKKTIICYYFTVGWYPVCAVYSKTNFLTIRRLNPSKAILSICCMYCIFGGK